MGLLSGHTPSADDVGAIQQESLADQRHVAFAANETFVVPVTIVERRKLRRSRSYEHIAHRYHISVAAVSWVKKGDGTKSCKFPK